MLLRGSLLLAGFALLTGCTELAANDDGAGGGSPSGGPSSGSGAQATGEGLPCDVGAIVAEACSDCHSTPPRYGAPMPLGSIEDVHAPAVSDPSRSVYELMLERLTAAENPMPPGGDIDPADRDVLVAWLQQGAPASEDSCGGQGGSGGTGPTPGPGSLPCEPTHVFTAHAPAGSEGFQVPEVGAENLYQCFTFKSPFGESTQATAWAPIIDDERVLHHWILYRTATPQEDGGVMPCAMPADATFVSGWAPGGDNFVLPEEVGLELGGQSYWYILQVHYHNTPHYADSVDKSGVAMCTTETKRPNTAGIVSLGTIGIDIPPHAMGHEESGVCPSWITNYLTEPLHMIASFPHMHERGRKFRTDILRGGSESNVETLVSVEHFSFDDQSYYEHSPAVMLNPGDALRTTCTYDNPGSTPVYFGEKTEDEMCFNFVMVHPVELLGNNRSCGLF